MLCLIFLCFLLCELQNRCLKIFTGHQHSVEKNLLKCDWSPDGTKVTAGSADRMVYVWETTMRNILYKVRSHREMSLYTMRCFFAAHLEKRKREGWMYV